MSRQIKSSETSWKIKMTQFSRRTENPLRKIWEGHKVHPNPKKETITLQIGEFIDVSNDLNVTTALQFLLLRRSDGFWKLSDCTRERSCNERSFGA